MRSLTRPLRAAVAAVLLAAPLIGVTAGTGAAAVLLPEPPDFATEAYADPWDYANPEDLNPAVGTNERVQAPTVAGGVLSMKVFPGGEYDPVWTVGGSIPWGRDGALQPVDAGRFNRLSFRMHSEVAGAGGFFWFTCRTRTPDCWGGMPISMRAGWNTYDVPIKRGFGATPAEWQGNIVALRFQPVGTAAGNPVQLDWLRVYQGGVAGAAPGTTPPEQTDLRPRPVVIDPDKAGGADYAATVRGDAWDFSSSSDVTSLDNITSPSFAGGILSGTNGGATPNDPQVGLPLAGPIDGNRFHRLSFRYRYDGPFGLADAPGGGMMSRFIWSVAGSTAYQDLDDVVTLPGWNDVTVDLATNPPGAITDSGTPVRIGWAGQRITSLRFDPNEDRGARRWHLDDVRIAADDAGSPSFDVRFRDDAWQAGTTAEIWADTDAAGFDGTRVAAGIAVQQGVNTFRLDSSMLPTGTYWIHIRMSDGQTSSRAYSTGPVQMVQPVQEIDPFGAFDAVRRTPGNLELRGWAVDPNTRTTPIDVIAYVDGRGFYPVRADGRRDDVAAAKPGYGSAHGYTFELPIGPGQHDVCTYALNVGPGTNRLLGCRRIDVASDPFGRLDGAGAGEGASGGTVVARGWAVDPDTTDSIDVHVYVDGRPAASVRAPDSRPDIAAAFPGYGPAHGFSVAVAAGPGSQVCAYAINRLAGQQNTTLGCRRV